MSDTSYTIPVYINHFFTFFSALDGCFEWQ